MKARRRTGANRQRGREIDACLQRWDLIGGPRRLDTAIRNAAESASEKLWQALAELGEPFIAFGAYLATRADVLPPRQCLRLAEVTDQSRSLPIEAVEELVARETGLDPQRVFSAVDPNPETCDLAVQVHEARTADGRAVNIEFSRANSEENGDSDLSALEFLAPAWHQVVDANIALQPVLAEFRSAWDARRNMAARSETMQALKRDLESTGQIAIPVLEAGLCTPNLLVVERLEGNPLNSMARSGALSQSRPHAENEALARRLSRVWLHLALVARQFPVAARLDDLKLLPDGRLALQRGVFGSLSARSQSNLWSYLQAVAADDSAGAGAWLLDELGSFDDEPDAAEFRTRIRQLVPFRDGSWSDQGETLAEHVFLQWRLARGCGYRLPHALVAFTRGLFSVASASRGLAGDRDSLREGLEDLRWQAGWGQLRQLTNFSELGGILQQNSMDLIELPSKLDRALSAAAQTLGRRTESPAAEARSPGEALSARGVALLALMAVVALFWRDLESLAWLGAWTERFLFLIFLTLGALLLVASGGRR